MFYHIFLVKMNNINSRHTSVFPIITYLTIREGMFHVKTGREKLLEIEESLWKRKNYFICK